MKQKKSRAIREGVAEGRTKRNQQASKQTHKSFQDKKCPVIWGADLTPVQKPQRVAKAQHRTVVGVPRAGPEEVG